MAGTAEGGLGASTRALASAYDTAFLDLDGVVYVGDHGVEGAEAALKAALEHGQRLVYITNNAARTPDAVAVQLRGLGLPADTDQVVTSAQAAARLLAERLPAGAPVLVVGGEGLRDALRERGLRPVGSSDDEPVAVVQGFGPDVGWRDLAQAGFAATDGLLWVASNLDRTIPVAGGRAPGNGTLVDAVAAAAGRRPDLVAGKPERALFDEARTRSGARRPLMVGDRLDTDVAGACRAGIDSLFVLTGVSDVIDLLRATGELQPTYVGRDLSALLRPQEHVGRTDGFTCGGWRVSVGSGELVHVQGAGHADDLLRALCAATWSSAEGALPEAASAVFASTSERIDRQG